MREKCASILAFGPRSPSCPFPCRAGNAWEPEGQQKAVKGELSQLVQLLLWQPEPKEVTIDPTGTQFFVLRRGGN